MSPPERSDEEAGRSRASGERAQRQGRLAIGSPMARLRVAVLEACGGCPERDSALRRELLCRCPVALAARLLRFGERVGIDGAALTPPERASLLFQERALNRSAPFDASAIDDALAHEDALGHAACQVPRCLGCEALRHLRAACQREPVATR